MVDRDNFVVGGTKAAGKEVKEIEPLLPLHDLWCYYFHCFSSN